MDITIFSSRPNLAPTQHSASSDWDATTALPDGRLAITKITNRKTIAGKPHYLVHWTDGTKTYEPEENISQAAKDAYLTRCRAQQKLGSCIST